MKKKNVLGHDPLGWMKVEREKKSLLPEVVKKEDKSTAKVNQQEEQDAVKQQSLIPSPKNESDTVVSGENQTERVLNVITGSNEPLPPKPKVVIGRLYEEISKKTANVAQHQHVAAPLNSSHKALSVEQPFPSSYETVKTDTGIQSRTIKSPVTESRIQFSTYLIVAYTVLLLILGYFVYTDFSKRTNRLEAKIYALERAMRLR